MGRQTLGGLRRGQRAPRCGPVEGQGLTLRSRELWRRAAGSADKATQRRHPPASRDVGPGAGVEGAAGVAGEGRRPPVETGYRVWDTGCGRPQTESPGPESCGRERESRYDGGAHPGRSREQRPAFGPHRAPHLLAVPPPAMKPHPGSAPPVRNDGHSGRGRGDRPALPPPPRARRPRGCSRRTWDPAPPPHCALHEPAARGRVAALYARVR